ncbi:MAG: enoyl-CoA hydratase [Mycobacterium sp.]|nr:enoyl-CoA hydratase [Mycobacterium sp.]
MLCWGNNGLTFDPASRFPPVSFLQGKPYPGVVNLGSRSRLRPVTDQSDQVLTRTENGVGLLVLNRPKAINSLTHSMVNAMHAVLREWEHDDDVRTVLVTGAGDRGLCAGGDIVAIYHSALTDGGSEARQFWYDEYVLNQYIARYPKPYVVVMDGIVMGGGVGVAVHGSTRIVTDTSKIAMPEVGIGFVPDVGGTYYLSRSPGRLGLHAALTGAPFTGSDAIAMGFADHYVPHMDLDDFNRTIVTDGVDAAIDRHAVAPSHSNLVAQRNWVDECYAGETVADIVAALRGHDAGPANDDANLIATRSPTSLAVALESVRRAAGLDTLEDILRQEYRVSCGTLRGPDLVEGIRAQVIDKDRNPKWSPSSLAAVSAADVDAFFAPVENDLSF